MTRVAASASTRAASYARAGDALRAAALRGGERRAVGRRRLRAASGEALHWRRRTSTRSKGDKRRGQRRLAELEPAVRRKIAAAVKPGDGARLWRRLVKRRKTIEISIMY